MEQEGVEEITFTTEELLSMPWMSVLPYEEAVKTIQNLEYRLEEEQNSRHNDVQECDVSTQG